MSHENSTLGPPVKSQLFVLSGLSGAGKDAVLARIRQSDYPIEFITTVTTRPRRPEEADGFHYRFVSVEGFRELIDRNELLEWATVYGNFYGVPREPVRQALESGSDVIIKVDVQGAATIKKLLPQAVFIFLAPASMDELALRLNQRRTESPSDLDLRLKTAEDELQQLHIFDYIVLNRQGEIGKAVSDVKAIIAAEKCRVVPREIHL